MREFPLKFTTSMLSSFINFHQLNKRNFFVLLSISCIEEEYYFWIYHKLENVYNKVANESKIKYNFSHKKFAHSYILLCNIFTYFFYENAITNPWKLLIHKMRSIVCNLHPQQVSATIVEYDYERKQLTAVRDFLWQKFCI